jgi:hypothetical protein
MYPCRVRAAHAFGQRLLAVALLLLLPLASVAGVGGWQCADGSPCRPATALTCCCAVAPPPVDDCCELELSPDALHLGAACGCHFHAEAADALLTAASLLDVSLALPPSAGVVIVRPLSASERSLHPAILHHPPRYLLSPADGRAPPVA